MYRLLPLSSDEFCQVPVLGHRLTGRGHPVSDRPRRVGAWAGKVSGSSSRAIVRVSTRPPSHFNKLEVKGPTWSLTVDLQEGLVRTVSRQSVRLSP